MPNVFVLVTLLSVILTALMMVYASLNYNLLDVLPLVRAQMMDELKDALVVCDQELNFLDANLSARRLFPQLSRLTPGEPITQVENFKTAGELRLWAGGEEQIYKIAANPILRGAKSSGVCVIFRNVTAETRLLKNLKRQAALDALDALTGIYNRGAFFNIARETLAQGRKKGLAFALLMIDIDLFKQVNDTHGHLCGDAVLKAVAGVVKEQFGKGNVVGRYGGEEFVVLLEDFTADQALAAEKLRNAVADADIRCQSGNVWVTVSIGAAFCPAGGSPSLEARPRPTRRCTAPKARGATKPACPGKRRRLR